MQISRIYSDGTGNRSRETIYMVRGKDLGKQDARPYKTEATQSGEKAREHQRKADKPAGRIATQTSDTGLRGDGTELDRVQRTEYKTIIDAFYVFCPF